VCECLCVVCTVNGDSHSVDNAAVMMSSAAEAVTSSAAELTACSEVSNGDVTVSDSQQQQFNSPAQVTTTVSTNLLK